MSAPQAPNAPEPSLLAAKQIEQLQQQVAGLNARQQAATQASHELTEVNIQLRAGITMMENQCRGFSEENAKLKIAASKNESAKEIERLNRVVEALDRQLATFVAENAAQAQEIATLKDNLGMKDANDGA